jgi:hypothetical protein
MQPAKSPDTLNPKHKSSQTPGLSVLTVEAVPQPAPVSPASKKGIFRRREAVCRCGWSKLHRARTHFYEWPLKIALVALRCERCRSRVLRMRFRRIPFVWFDFALNKFSSLRRRPVFVGILLILSAATIGAILGYWVSEIGKPVVPLY